MLDQLFLNENPKFNLLLSLKRKKRKELTKTIHVNIKNIVFVNSHGRDV
jgi:hypothetical protein